jgi:PAS domain S-box-containing protein
VLAFVPRALLTRQQDRGAASGVLASKEEDRLRLEALVEASTDCVLLSDPQGRVVYLNPAGRRMVGVGRGEDVTGLPVADLVDAQPRPGFEDFGPDGDRTRRLVTGAEKWPGEQVVRRLDGGQGTPVISSSFALRHPVTGEEWLHGAIHRDIGEAVEVRRQLVETAHERQALLAEVVRAQEEERARIAADVHDDSVQSLIAVDLRLQLLERRLGPDAPEALALLGEVHAAVRTATERLRHLLFDLDVPVLETDLVTALRDAAAFVLGSAVTWEVDGPDDLDLPEVTRVVAYRIAQQALQNVAEHAAATQVQVVVRQAAHEVVVEVRDDGCGYEPADAVDRAGHLGLRSMRQRALAVGGRVEVASAPGQGTAVTVTLPRTALA